MTIEFISKRSGRHIKQWPNWTGIVPAIGDTVILHYGDYNEIEENWKVIERIISGTEPDKVVITIEKL